MVNQEDTMDIVPIKELAISSENKNRLDEVKNRLQKFAKSVPDSVYISAADNAVPMIGQLFGADLVKSADVNRIVKQVCRVFIAQNKTLQKLFKEFGTVYETVSVLDEGYITDILRSFNLAARAYNTAQKNFKVVEKQMAAFIKKQKAYNIQFEEQISQLRTVIEKIAKSPAKASKVK